MGKYFGTDGIRGIVGQGLTHSLCLRAGGAVASLIGRGGCVLVGMDTRESGRAIAYSFMGACAWMGVDCVFCGIASTPQLAYCTRALGFDLGIMISASHNQAHFNGLKFFDKNGYKLDGLTEQKFEKLMAKKQPVSSANLGKIYEDFSLKNAYKNALKNIEIKSLSEHKILLDLGEGASHESAPFAFGMLSCQTHFVAHRGIGRRINEGCGAAHPQMLSELVVKMGCNMGFSFDGDADRIIACDSEGTLIDGDKLLYILALDLKQRSELKSGVIVGTEMSNLGLEDALNRQGIRLLRTAVGDKFVAEKMRETASELGGEGSGHIIFSRYSTTGDGVLTALLTADLVARRGELSELLRDYEHCPQITVNLKITDSILQRLGQAEFESLKQQLSSQSIRILVRRSGTEPLLRLTVEGRDEATVRAVIGEMTDFLQG